MNDGLIETETMVKRRASLEAGWTRRRWFPAAMPWVKPGTGGRWGRHGRRVQPDRKAVTLVKRGLQADRLEQPRIAAE